MEGLPVDLVAEVRLDHEALLEDLLPAGLRLQPDLFAELAGPAAEVGALLVPVDGAAPPAAALGRGLLGDVDDLEPEVRELRGGEGLAEVLVRLAGVVSGVRLRRSPWRRPAWRGGRSAWGTARGSG